MNDDGTGAKLYDLSKDHVEAKNVIAAHPDVAKRLTEKVLAWRTSVP